MATDNFPIGAHAAIGDCRSLALVATDGTIDWFCPSVFSAPSLFAALLDAARGGRFALGCPPADLRRPPLQSYVAGTNVLTTRFEAQGGVLQLTDGHLGTALRPGRALGRVAHQDLHLLAVREQLLRDGAPHVTRNSCDDEHGPLRWRRQAAARDLTAGPRACRTSREG